MKRKGPILTLAAGVVLAAVLMVLNLNATRSQPTAAAPTDKATTAAATATPTAAPTPAAVVPAGPPVTYAGNVTGGGATIAIAVKDGKAIAYLCDGRSAEAWLQGTAQNGALNLTGPEGAGLTGTYANGVAAGVVTAVGRDFSFSVGTVEPPSGLYRASANVANATVVDGWIVLADGTQVGTQKKGTTITGAPRLNLPAKTAVVDGVTINATMLDGTRL